MNLKQFKKELNKNSIFADETLLSEVIENKFDINKLYNEFVKFRKSIKIMSSKEYGKKYSRIEFYEDIEEFTLCDYNGCFIEYNKNPVKFYVPLYNGGYEGILSDCEIYLFIHFYMYEYINRKKLEMTKSRKL